MRLKLTAFVVAALVGTVAQAQAFKELVRSYSANINPNGYQAGTITIMCDTAKLLVGFVDTTHDTMPANRYDAGTKTGNGYLPWSSFQAVLDLLRNGGPVYVAFAPDESPPKFVICGSK